MEMVCILCPMGCALEVLALDGEIDVSGNACVRGARYARQEMSNPMRMVTTSVRVEGSELPLCPAKTAELVGKARIADVLAAARLVHVEVPVRIGDVLAENVAGTGVDLVATANR